MLYSLKFSSDNFCEIHENNTIIKNILLFTVSSTTEKHILKCFIIIEVFMDFIIVDRIPGSAIAEAILQCLSQWNLPLFNLRGQCYDGSSNMAGAI